MFNELKQSSDQFDKDLSFNAKKVLIYIN